MQQRRFQDARNVTKVSMNAVEYISEWIRIIMFRKNTFTPLRPLIEFSTGSALPIDYVVAIADVNYMTIPAGGSYG